MIYSTFILHPTMGMSVGGVPSIWVCFYFIRRPTHTSGHSTLEYPPPSRRRRLLMESVKSVCVTRVTGGGGCSWGSDAPLILYKYLPGRTFPLVPGRRGPWGRSRDPCPVGSQAPSPLPPSPFPLPRRNLGLSQGTHSINFSNSPCFPCPTAHFPCANFSDL